jgi:hypothetical protein
MSEVTSGKNLTVIVLDEDETDGLARLLELEVLNEGHEAGLLELAEALN